MFQMNPATIAAIAAGSLAAHCLWSNREKAPQDQGQAPASSNDDRTVVFGLGAGTGSYQYYRA